MFSSEQHKGYWRSRSFFVFFETSANLSNYLERINDVMYSVNLFNSILWRFEILQAFSYPPKLQTCFSPLCALFCAAYNISEHLEQAAQNSVVSLYQFCVDQN